MHNSVVGHLRADDRTYKALKLRTQLGWDKRRPEDIVMYNPEDQEVDACRL